MMQTILIISMVVLLSTSVLASHYEQRDFVAILTGIETRVQYAKPYLVEQSSEGFLRRFIPQDNELDDDTGFFYSYSYPRIYPRVPEVFRQFRDFRHSVKVSAFTHDQMPRFVTYVFDPGYFEKGYAQVNRALPVNAVLPEDRAFSFGKRRIYPNGVRLDIG